MSSFVRGTALLVTSALPAFGLSVEAAPLPWLDTGALELDHSATLMLDHADTTDLPRRGDEASAWLLRRAAVQSTLTLSRRVSLEGELAFEDADNAWTWRDAFVALDLPDGWYASAGRQKQDFGLSHTASLRNSLSLERPQALDLLALPRADGLVLGREWGHGLLQAQWFRHEENDRAVDTYSLRGVHVRDDARYWHAGFSLSRSFLNGAEYRVDSPAQTALLEKGLRTSRITADEVLYTGLDTAWRAGRATLLAEGIHTRVTSRREGDREYSGAYAQAAWFLTQDQHRFGAGTLRGLRVSGGVAAEVVATLGWLDAFSRNDGFVSRTATVGLNFYLGRDLKLMVESGRVEIVQGEDRGEQGTLAQMRLQWRF